MGFWDYIPSYALVHGIGQSNDERNKLLGGNFGDPMAKQQLSTLQGLAMQRAQGFGPSVADMQGRAMLGQGLASLNSMATGARPGTEGLAMRQAAQQGSALTGRIAEQTQAMRLAEQMQNMGLAGNLLLGGRQLDLQSTMAGMQQPAGWERVLGATGNAAQIAGMASDRRLKTEIEDGDDVVRETLDGLRAFAFKYKDARYGKGGQVGIMAQDLERTRGGKQAVIDTPAGKMVDGAKLAGLAVASAVDLHKRMKKLEAQAA